MGTMKQSEIVSQVAEIVRQTRDEYTLDEFGRILGVSYEAVRQYELGHMMPQQDTLARWLEHPEPYVREMARKIANLRYGFLVNALAAA